MSHYARTVAPVTGWIDKEPGTIPTDTEIKNVRLNSDGGGYTCEASLRVGLVSHSWCTFVTQEDLPAFTDKGRAHRERGVTPTLKPGRPPGGGTKQERAIAFRPTTEQRAWLQKHAKRHKVTLSQLIRIGLTKLGMPR